MGVVKTTAEYIYIYISALWTFLTVTSYDLPVFFPIFVLDQIKCAECIASVADGLKIGSRPRS